MPYFNHIVLSIVSISRSFKYNQYEKVPSSSSSACCSFYLVINTQEHYSKLAREYHAKLKTLKLRDTESILKKRKKRAIQLALYNIQIYF